MQKLNSTRMGNTPNIAIANILRVLAVKVDFDAHLITVGFKPAMKLTKNLKK
jgi:hypothetical protein